MFEEINCQKYRAILLKQSDNWRRCDLCQCFGLSVTELRFQSFNYAKGIVTAVNPVKALAFDVEDFPVLPVYCFQAESRGRTFRCNYSASESISVYRNVGSIHVCRISFILFLKMTKKHLHVAVQFICFAESVLAKLLFLIFSCLLLMLEYLFNLKCTTPSKAAIVLMLQIP